MEALDGHVQVIDEVHGFRSFDQRDLLGFVDGTENPEGAAALAAIHRDRRRGPEFAGGSYVIVQKYLHDLTGWDALPVEQQEAAVGRTKLSDIELSDDVKPSNSHVALTVIERDGEEREILRFNMPFGRVGEPEFGTYFIGYASTPDVTEQMLRNMFIGDPPGNHDRLLDFSRAVTGTLFFVPTVDLLDDPPGLQTVTAEATPTAETSSDGSLGIGAMRPG